MPKRGFFTRQEATHQLNLSLSTVDQLLRTNQLEHVHRGRHVYIPRRAIEGFLEARPQRRIGADPKARRFLWPPKQNGYTTRYDAPRPELAARPPRGPREKKPPTRAWRDWKSAASA
jgi:excisionase family DNA binding protein